MITNFIASVVNFFRILYLSLWTLKRDILGAIIYLRAQLAIRNAQKYNLTAHEMFDEVAERYPDKVCVHFQEEKWTYKQVQEVSNQVGNYFDRLGYKKGDSVALYMDNKPEYIVTWMGLSRIGVVTALVNTNLRSNALIHCFEAASCRAIVYGQELSDAIEDVVNDGKLKNTPLFHFSSTEDNGNYAKVSSSTDIRKALQNVSNKTPTVKDVINFRDNMLYIYTSGTTGLPKAAYIKHSRFIMMSTITRISHGFKASDTIYTPLPMYHVTGGICAVGVSLYTGSSVVIRKKFSATQYWTDCVKYDVTVIQYIGEICRFLLSQPLKPEDTLHKIRFAYGLGLRPEIWTAFTQRFNIPKIIEVYGSTEGNVSLGNLDGTPGAVGFIPHLLTSFLPYFLVKINKETGEIVRNEKSGLVLKCGANEPGELIGLIKTGSAMNEFGGYTDEKAKQKKILSNVLRKGDSAFRTGDLLRMDEYGYFYFLDRQGDTFRWRGENVSTAEVEIVISRIVGLKDVGVYGVLLPGNEGRAGMASIADPDNEVNLDQLAVAFKKELPTYARPIFIRILKEMPMTASFKLKKVDLQKEGYYVSTPTNKVFVFLSKEQTYVPLTQDIYSQIQSAQFKI